MKKESRVAAFQCGELHELKNDASGREVVLALPLSRLLMRVVRVPAGEDAVATALPVLKAISPFPDDPLAVSCETVVESPESSVVLAAALPESAVEDVGEALDAAKLSIVRVDALVLGALRKLWAGLNVSDGRRRLLVLTGAEDIVLVVLDGDLPVSVRAIPDAADLSREKWFSLLEAEDFNGPKELAETVEREIDTDAALAGCAERAAETGTLDVLPDSWREVLQETRFKRKLFGNLLVAGVLWLVAMGVLLGVPVAYGFMTDHMKGLSRAHAREFKSVKEKKEKTELVRKYSDHARGALEIMKAVSDRLPGAVTLSDWRYDREKGVTVRGEADDKEPIYQLKDALTALGTEPDAEGNPGEAVFKEVELGAVNFSGGRQKFEITCSYESEEE